MAVTLLRFRWVLFFSLFCFFLFEQRLKHIHEDTLLLSSQKQKLEEAIHDATGLNEELSRKHNSQSDPAWVEITLMREMGVVPEGHRKVLFTS